MRCSEGDGPKLSHSRMGGCPMGIVTIGVVLTVYVREYLRFRLGKWEQVRAHFRNPPCR